MRAATPTDWEVVDPFDLPEWIGTDDVTWAASCAFGEPLLTGTLRDDGDGTELACDLLAADVACPRPVVDETTRIAVHQAWRLGQVHLIRAASDARLTLAVPAVAHSTDSVLEVIGRLAQAVGAPRERFGVRLRAGR